MEQFGVTTNESSKDGYHVDIEVVGLNIGPDCTHLRPATHAEYWTAVRKANAHDVLEAALRNVERALKQYRNDATGQADLDALAVDVRAALAKAGAQS